MRVMLAEDSTLLRAGIERLLQDEGHTVTAAVGTAVEIVHAVAQDPPDLVILDVRMPPTHTTEGLDAALEIRRRWPEVSTLVLSQYIEHRTALDLLTAGDGRVGYLLKDRVANVDGFLADLDRVAAGGTAFDPEVVRQLFLHSRRQDPLVALTERERGVLALLAQGLTNTGIADRLHLSRSAVEKHINAIFDKLELARDARQSRRVLAVLRFLESGS